MQCKPPSCCCIIQASGDPAQVLLLVLLEAEVGSAQLLSYLSRTTSLQGCTHSNCTGMLHVTLYIAITVVYCYHCSIWVPNSVLYVLQMREFKDVAENTMRSQIGRFGVTGPTQVRAQAVNHPLAWGSRLLYADRNKEREKSKAYAFIT